MRKIKEAIEILKALGLPEKQQKERSGRTLCAIADVKPKTPWSDVKIRLIIIHDVMQFIKTNFKFTYAENSRETIRRQTIHQFEQARIVDRNFDDPSRPTNSGKTVYSITKDALPVIRAYGTPKFAVLVKKFNDKYITLRETYEKRNRFQQIAIGTKKNKIYLSPGKHNQLQKDIIEKFFPRFARNAILLYLGDTAKKYISLKNDKMIKLNIPVTEHDKLPDIILFDEKKSRLYLMEAVTSHGPVSPKRHFEIEKMLKDCLAEKIYISAFPDFKTYLKYATDIAWETEVWAADNPDHMIHYNGDKFIGIE